MLQAVKNHVPVEAVAVHFHNTYSTALPNILVALQVCSYTLRLRVRGCRWSGCRALRCECHESGNVDSRGHLRSLMLAVCC